MVVQHNLTAMNSNRMLGLTTASQAKSTEKLSSGYKINRAADDAAGLSISEKMRKQIRGLSQASLNAQDGISAVQTAEGALNEVQDMLQRMNELAVKSANGTMSESDRSYIQNEVDQLITEIDRVAETTKFNETYLLKGDATAEKVKTYEYSQLQYTANKPLFDELGVEVEEGTILNPEKTYSTTRTAAGVGTEEVDATNDQKDNGLFTATKVTASTALFTRGEDGEVVYIDAGTEIAVGTEVFGNAKDAADLTKSGYVIDGADLDGATNKAAYSTAGLAPTGLSNLKDAGGTGLTTKLTVSKAESSIALYTVDGAGNATKFAAGEEIDIAGSVGGSVDYYKAVEYTPSNDVTSADFAEYGEAIKLQDADGNEVAANGLYSYFDEEGEYLGGLYDANGVEMTADQIDTMISQVEKETGALELTLHVGADATENNQISVKVDAMSASSLGIEGLKVDGKDDSNALDAIETIKASIQMVSEQRSALGAVQNRLEHTINNLDNVVENTTAAESQIRDTDMATEMVKYSNNNILAQAGQAMLAQANQANQGVLSLLG